MSEVQRAHDVGTVLRLLPDLLCLEVHQLRRDYRSHHLQQPAQELGGSRCTARPACATVSGDTLTTRPRFGTRAPSRRNRRAVGQIETPVASASPWSSRIIVSPLPTVKMASIRP